MSASLLDVNVLIALAYEWHVNHSLVQGWFRESAEAWATCPLTESGFVRIACNPGAIRQSVKAGEALRMLSTITVRPGYRFWPGDITFAEAVQPFRERLFGHRQVTDAYLLGLAIRNKGRLVTLDSGIEALAGREFARYVTLLR
ncbi:MAG: TA system VapC family ribonuclease toxin [Candidatus Korobacteraceae bacterium]